MKTGPSRVIKVLIILSLLILAGVLLTGCHEHEFVEKIIENATCGQVGTKELTCSVCGRTETEEIPATGIHKYSNKVTTQATCAATGIKTFTCSVCGDAYTEEIPKNDKHTYKSTVKKEATCTADGTLEKKCSVCGDSKTEKISAKGHNYKTETTPATCTANGYINHTCTKKQSMRRGILGQQPHVQPQRNVRFAEKLKGQRLGISRGEPPAADAGQY